MATVSAWLLQNKQKGLIANIEQGILNDEIRNSPSLFGVPRLNDKVGQACFLFNIFKLNGMLQNKNALKHTYFFICN